DKEKNHRGRVKQKVTIKNRGQKLMEVSPHLNIYKVMSSNYTPKTFKEANILLQECYESLLEIYKIVVYQSRQL
ncbi:MAG: hypothetical protein ABI550_03300, partial [Ignavibacteriaceae bacterium]